jgi:hypothetical protein
MEPENAAVPEQVAPTGGSDAPTKDTQEAAVQEASAAPAPIVQEVPAAPEPIVQEVPAAPALRPNDVTDEYIVAGIREYLETHEIGASPAFVVSQALFPGSRVESRFLNLFRGVVDEMAAARKAAAVSEKV